MQSNKAIKCNVDECVYNDPNNSHCTLDDISVTYDQDMELDAICASFETVDDFDEDTDDTSNDK